MNILVAVLVLGLIIFIHELGHFTMAKIFKMPVSEFAIGMGPTVYSYTTMETVYSIRAIPIGGYVSIDGMEIDSEVEDGFNTKPAYARFLVLIAGVFMNFLMAFIILFVSIFINGIKEVENIPVINKVFPEAKAYNYIKAKDKILKIDGYEIRNWEDIGNTISKVENKENVVIELERAGELKKLDVPLTKISDEGKYILGVMPNLISKKISLLEASKMSINAGINIVEETINGLKLLVTGKVKAKELAGPIGIINLVGQASQQNNTMMLIWLMAVISINIGVLNLLPFPALDGGRILFVVLESLGIKIDKKFEERVHIIGMVILFGFIIYVTSNDITRLIK